MLWTLWFNIAGLIDEANKRLTVNLCNSWIEEELGGVIYSGTKTLLLQFKHNLVDCLAEMLPLNVSSNIVGLHFTYN